MSKYVDGFVMAVPTKNTEAYKKMAKEASKVWKKFGALDYKECMGEDMTPDSQGQKMLTFPQILKLKPDETAWFSYIVYKSRAHRDAVNKKVMKHFDEKYKDMKDMKMPFDMKRVALGGFSVMVE